MAFVEVSTGLGQAAANVLAGLFLQEEGEEDGGWEWVEGGGEKRGRGGGRGGGGVGCLGGWFC